VRYFALFFVILFPWSSTASASWDKSLAEPVHMSARQMDLADAELDLADAGAIKVVYASEYYREQTPAERVVEISGELEVNYYSGRKGASDLIGKQLYVEAKLPESDVSVWGFVYHDPEFHELYAGLAKQLGNWQVALGAGVARYGGENHIVITPWVYYESDDYEVSFLIERYLNEQDEPWFYKGTLKKKFGSYAFGIYGEKGIGIGPLFSYAVSDALELWCAAPIALQPEEGGAAFILGLRYGF